MGAGQRRTAHEIIQLKQKQIELEDQLGFDRLQSEMRTLHNLQTKITKNDQRLQVQEKILSDLRQNDLDVVQKFSLLSSYEDTVLKTGQTISSPLRVGPDGELLDSKGEVAEVVVTPEQSSLDDRAWIKLYQEVKELRRKYQGQRLVFLPGHPTMKKLSAELKLPRSH